MRLRSRGDKAATAVDEAAPVVEAPLAPSAPAPTNADRVRLGELLIAKGLISEEDLEQALRAQHGSGKRLGEVLVQLGILGERDFLSALSEQFGIPLVDLRHVMPDADALTKLPEAMVRADHVLPVRIDDGALVVAIAVEPTVELTQELSAAAGTTIRYQLALLDDIDRAIDRSYSALSELDRYVSAYEVKEEAVPEEAADALDIDENAPVIQVVTRILTQAVRARASDVHIEPQDKRVRVRFRVDGALHDAASLPIGIAQSLVSRIKIMADMNIVDRRRPQDGQFEAKVDGRSLDVRVATTATIWGEKAVLRILDKSRSLLELGRLGMPPGTREQFSTLIRSPFGMVICAGPTGSGKTTTLYAALSEINDPERNITTIEDPVEYVIPTINQIQINEQAEITFAGGLKSILRQDPDIILVGEIRDVETARIAVQSALTGHLVLSSLHATDSTAALYRFVDMGIEPFLVASSVLSVVAQRLVRRICTACKAPYDMPADERALYDEWGGIPKDQFWHGAGCNFCAGTGYADRVGVYELLRITEEIRELIVERAPHDELRALAVEQGLRTLRDQTLRLVEHDVTTIAEILRTVYVA